MSLPFSLPSHTELLCSHVHASVHACTCRFDKESGPLALYDAEAISDMTTQALINHVCNP